MYGPSVIGIPAYYGQGSPFCSPTQMFCVQAHLCIENSYLLHRNHQPQVLEWGGGRLGRLGPEGRGNLTLWPQDRRKPLPEKLVLFLLLNFIIF